MYAAPHNAPIRGRGHARAGPAARAAADEGDGPAAAPVGRDIVSPLVGVFHELAEANGGQE